MKYVFGPVFSRRLGISLGIDLVPFKVCSMDCLYCEVGKTTEKTLERAEYVPVEPVKEELKNFLSHNPDLDFITFSGYGEPTLNSKLGELVTFLKENYQNYKLALLTNASLLTRDDVINDIKRLDVILPSIDAAREKTFENLNRPAKGLKLTDIVHGVERTLKEVPGEVWIETVFVKGVNDSDEELKAFRELINSLKPDKWQIGTVVRPPAYKVRGLSTEELERIREIVNYPSTEIIAPAGMKPKGKVTLDEIKREVLSIVKRRPCPIEEISSALGIEEEELEKAIDELKNEGKVKEILFGGVPYVKGV